MQLLPENVPQSQSKVQKRMNERCRFFNRCNFNLLWHQNTIGASIFKMGAKKMKKVQKELYRVFRYWVFGYRIVGCFFLIRITIDLVKGGDYIHIVFYFCFADAHKLLIA